MIMDCKWLTPSTGSYTGFICGYWGRCPEIMDHTSTCPVIEYARAFEIACENPDVIEQEKKMLRDTI